VIVTAPGSEVTMMLATVFLQPSNAPLLDGETFADVASHPRAAFAAPLAFGDVWRDHPIVGTTEVFASHLAGRDVDFGGADGAVVGALVPLQPGDTFMPVHGAVHSDDPLDLHAQEITVAGRMPPTGSPWDRAIVTDIRTMWGVHGFGGHEGDDHGDDHAEDDGHAEDHADGHGQDHAGDHSDDVDQEHAEDHAEDHERAEVMLFDAGNGGLDFDPRDFPGTPAIVVRTETLGAAYAIQSQFTSDPRTMAFFPGGVLSDLHRIMGDAREAMSAMILVSQALVGAAVVVGLAILVQLFRRQVALLRAVGAPGRFVAAVIWGYAAALLTVGAVAGLVLGYAAAWAIGRVLAARLQFAVPVSPGWPEMQLVAGFVGISAVIALIPALLALRQPVLRGLRG
jgi:putative ABC transport system permease protein